MRFSEFCESISNAFLASVPTALPVSSQVTTVFVHPMSPARQQQQSVGSSVSSGQSGPSDEVRSGGAPGDVASEGGEVDNIVSSSVVDQPLLEEVCRFDLNSGEFIRENFKLLYFI